MIHGDSITGPFFDQLLTYPGTGQPIEDLMARGLSQALRARLAGALEEVKNLRASVGTDLNDIERKEAAKQRLDSALAPFRALAAAWTGGVMLGPGRSISADGEEVTGCDDGAYLALARTVAHEGDIDALCAALPALDRMILTGAEGVPYDLIFPEVFYPDGDVEDRTGFDAVLGNPPWEGVRRSDDQFFSATDLRILSLPSKGEKQTVIDELLSDSTINKRYRNYVRGFESTDRICNRIFSVHLARVKGNLAGRGTYDQYMLFGERGISLLREPAGFLGLVLPSAFHANEGGTGLRRLLLGSCELRYCFSFENRNKLFEIDSRYKFAVTVAQKKIGGTEHVSCRFYLHDPEWLFSDRKDTLNYSIRLIEDTGGEYLSFLELREPIDASVARQCYTEGLQFGQVREGLGLKLSQEVNMTYDSHRFTASNEILSGEDDARDPAVAVRLRAQG